MTVQEVITRQHARAFLGLPKKIYRCDPNWIAPPENDIAAIFDPARNTFFEDGICTRWLLLDNHGEPIGRIAAFINYRQSGNFATGGIGFFECADDTAAAHLLFDTARNWLSEQGMQAMEGPVNFGENDRYWGLLAEGFDCPSYGMNYNPPYYIRLFESYGFAKKYDQLTNSLDVTQPMPERFTRIAERVMRNPDYHFAHFSYARREKFFEDFRTIYNDAWHDFENFHPIDAPTIRESFRQMKPVMDEKIIWFAYHRDEPVAFVICLPDINPLLKQLHGKMNLLGKLRFLWYRQFTPVEKLRIIVMGCRQRFQNHGIESALIRCLQEEVLPRQTIREIELAWVGDFNKKMIALHQATGAKPSKVHRTYQYLFHCAVSS